jgi:hypothetical protein
VSLPGMDFHFGDILTFGGAGERYSWMKLRLKM